MGHSDPHRELSEEDYKFKLTYRDHVPKKRKGEKEDRYPHRSVWIHEFGDLPLSEKACEKASSPGEGMGSYFWL